MKERAHRGLYIDNTIAFENAGTTASYNNLGTLNRQTDKEILRFLQILTGLVEYPL